MNNIDSYMMSGTVGTFSFTSADRGRNRIALFVTTNIHTELVSAFIL